MRFSFEPKSPYTASWWFFALMCGILSPALALVLAMALVEYFVDGKDWEGFDHH